MSTGPDRALRRRPTAADFFEPDPVVVYVSDKESVTPLLLKPGEEADDESESSDDDEKEIGGDDMNEEEDDKEKGEIAKEPEPESTATEATPMEGVKTGLKLRFSSEAWKAATAYPPIERVRAQLEHMEATLSRMKKDKKIHDEEERIKRRQKENETIKQKQRTAAQRAMRREAAAMPYRVVGRTTRRANDREQEENVQEAGEVPPSGEQSNRNRRTGRDRVQERDESDIPSCILSLGNLSVSESPRPRVRVRFRAPSPESPPPSLPKISWAQLNEGVNTSAADSTPRSLAHTPAYLHPSQRLPTPSSEPRARPAIDGVPAPAPRRKYVMPSLSPPTRSRRPPSPFPRRSRSPPPRRSHSPPPRPSNPAPGYTPRARRSPPPRRRSPSPSARGRDESPSSRRDESPSPRRRYSSAARRRLSPSGGRSPSPPPRRRSPSTRSQRQSLRLQRQPEHATPSTAEMDVGMTLLSPSSKPLPPATLSSTPSLPSSAANATESDATPAIVVTLSSPKGTPALLPLVSILAPEPVPQMYARDTHMAASGSQLAARLFPEQQKSNRNIPAMIQQGHVPIAQAQLTHHLLPQPIQLPAPPMLSIQFQVPQPPQFPTVQPMSSLQLSSVCMQGMQQQPSQQTQAYVQPIAVPQLPASWIAHTHIPSEPKTLVGLEMQTDRPNGVFRPSWVHRRGRAAREAHRRQAAKLSKPASFRTRARKHLNPVRYRPGIVPALVARVYAAVTQATATAVRSMNRDDAVARDVLRRAHAKANSGTQWKSVRSAATRRWRADSHDCARRHTWMNSPYVDSDMDLPDVNCNANQDTGGDVNAASQTPPPLPSTLTTTVMEFKGKGKATTADMKQWALEGELLNPLFSGSVTEESPKTESFDSKSQAPSKTESFDSRNQTLPTSKPSESKTLKSLHANGSQSKAAESSDLAVEAGKCLSLGLQIHDSRFSQEQAMALAKCSSNGDYLAARLSCTSVSEEDQGGSGSALAADVKPFDQDDMDSWVWADTELLEKMGLTQKEESAQQSPSMVLPNMPEGPLLVANAPAESSSQIESAVIAAFSSASPQVTAQEATTTAASPSRSGAEMMSQLAPRRTPSFSRFIRVKEAAKYPLCSGVTLLPAGAQPPVQTVDCSVKMSAPVEHRISEIVPLHIRENAPQPVSSSPKSSSASVLVSAPQAAQRQENETVVPLVQQARSEIVSLPLNSTSNEPAAKPASTPLSLSSSTLSTAALKISATTVPRPSSKTDLSSIPPVPVETTVSTAENSNQSHGTLLPMSDKPGAIQRPDANRPTEFLRPLSATNVCPAATQQSFYEKLASLPPISRLPSSLVVPVPRRPLGAKSSLRVRFKPVWVPPTCRQTEGAVDKPHVHQVFTLTQFSQEHYGQAMVETAARNAEMLSADETGHGPAKQATAAQGTATPYSNHGFADDQILPGGFPVADHLEYVEVDDVETAFESGLGSESLWSDAGHEHGWLNVRAVANIAGDAGVLAGFAAKAVLSSVRSVAGW